MCDRCKKEDHDCYEESQGADKPESDYLLSAEEIAFVQGAKWWEYHSTKFTMWGSDQELAAKEAQKEKAAGRLGKWKVFPF